MGLEQRGRIRRSHERNNWKQDDFAVYDRQTGRRDWRVCLMGAEVGESLTLGSARDWR
jgi:hypothetical protein